MPKGLKLAAVFNLAAVAFIGWFAWSAGGFAGGAFAPEHPVELKLAPVALPEAAAAAPAPRIEVPAAFRGADPSPPWEVLADGSVRFRD